MRWFRLLKKLRVNVYLHGFTLFIGVPSYLDPHGRGLSTKGGK